MSRNMESQRLKASLPPQQDVNVEFREIYSHDLSTKVEAKRHQPLFAKVDLFEDKSVNRSRRNVLLQLRRKTVTGKWTREGVTFKNEDTHKFLMGFLHFINLAELSPTCEYQIRFADKDQTASWDHDRKVVFRLVNEKSRITYYRQKADETGGNSIEITLEAEEAADLRFIVPLLLHTCELAINGIYNEDRGNEATLQKKSVVADEGGSSLEPVVDIERASCDRPKKPKKAKTPASTERKVRKTADEEEDIDQRPSKYKKIYDSMTSDSE